MKNGWKTVEVIATLVASGAALIDALANHSITVGILALSLVAFMIASIMLQVNHEKEYKMEIDGLRREGFKGRMKLSDIPEEEIIHIMTLARNLAGSHGNYTHNLDDIYNDLSAHYIEGTSLTQLVNVTCSKCGRPYSCSLKATE